MGGIFERVDRFHNGVKVYVCTQYLDVTIFVETRQIQLQGMWLIVLETGTAHSAFTSMSSGHCLCFSVAMHVTECLSNL